MPHFLCRLATEDGQIQSQSFFSTSLQDCRRHFESEGFCILSIKKDWKKIQISMFSQGKKIKDKDFVMYNQEIVALIKAGYPILKSIEIIVSRAKNVHMKELLMRIEKEIRGGKSLSEAFAPFDQYFSKVYIASLMAGERSGNLAETITRYNDYAKVMVATKSKIRSAMAYPTILLCFSLVLLGVLINFIIPRFSDFYQNFDSELPAVTKSLLAFSKFAKKNVIFILAFVLVLVFIFFRMRRGEKSSVLLARLQLKIPYGRPIWIESAISLFCRTLGLLLEGGISLLSSIGVATKAAPNKYLVEKMKNLPEFIKNGESLSESLKKAEFFTPLALDMIRIGEASADLEGMLAQVADVYDERIRSRIDTFVSLIEPIIIVIMGLVVAAMLLSVYLPIFNIIRVVQ
ncbi:MAG: type II secretion system F family protein [Candidatus Aminicenantes bacterium]|nr:type II secretion system F family protein [Candidatus Aminicenantes bacterium]